MNFSSLLNRPVTRREALRRVGGGFGMVGLALQAATTNVPASPWSVKPPHFAPKAKHVIFLFLNGGLSHIDSFDYKPLLDQYDVEAERCSRDLLQLLSSLHEHGLIQVLDDLPNDGPDSLDR